MDQYLPDIREVAVQTISISYWQRADHARTAGDKGIAIANPTPGGDGLHPRQIRLPRQYWTQGMSFRSGKRVRAIERDARAYQGPVALRIAIQSRTIGRMNTARCQALSGKLLQHGPKPGELGMHALNVRRIRAGQL